MVHRPLRCTNSHNHNNNIAIGHTYKAVQSSHLNRKQGATDRRGGHSASRPGTSNRPVKHWRGSGHHFSKVYEHRNDTFGMSYFSIISQGWQWCECTSCCQTILNGSSRIHPISNIISYCILYNITKLEISFCSQLCQEEMTLGEEISARQNSKSFRRSSLNMAQLANELMTCNHAWTS